MHIPKKRERTSDKDFYKRYDLYPVQDAYTLLLRLYMATVWYPGLSDDEKGANQKDGPTHPKNEYYANWSGRPGIHLNSLFYRSGVPNHEDASTWGQTMVAFERLQLLEKKPLQLSPEDLQKKRESKRKSGACDYVVFPGEKLADWLEGKIELMPLEYEGSRGPQKLDPPEGKKDLVSLWINSSNGRKALDELTVPRDHREAERRLNEVESDATKGDPNTTIL